MYIDHPAAVTADSRQLEIGLPIRPINPAKRRRMIRAARARWWFGRMRQVVDSASGWAVAPRS